MTTDRLVFWQNCLSHHQSALLRALSAISGGPEVVLVTETEIPAWRRELGWSRPDFGLTKLLIGPSDEQVRRLATDRIFSTVHIFSGTRGYPVVWNAFQEAVRIRAHIGILSEPGKWLGAAGRLRWLRAAVDRHRFEPRVDFVLAIGHLAQAWFRSTGYPESKLFPYGYFVETGRTAASAPSAPGDDESLNLVFVGQCIPRKGLDKLIESLGQSHQRHWRLSVIGDGSHKQMYMKRCQELGLSKRVTFTGALPNADAMKHVQNADWLLLPSRWDGWGAVVNEALTRGVPVLCSDRCGAADLIVSPRQGMVFDAANPTAFASALRACLERGKQSVRERELLKDWSSCISGQTAAAYLLEILNHVYHPGTTPRPTPPWRIGLPQPASAIS